MEYWSVGVMGKSCAGIAFAAALGLLSACGMISRNGNEIRAIDHMVPHVSTVPANKGEPARIYVREKMLIGDGSTPRQVVLIVHGGGFTGRQPFVFNPGGDRIELCDESWKPSMPTPTYEEILAS